MKILVALDGSAHSRRVLDHLTAHPELLGANADVTLLTVVAAVPSHAARFVTRTMLDQYYTEEADQVLAPARAHLVNSGIAAQTVPSKGDAATQIAEHASQGGFDLIVMGSHGHSALGNVALGSVVTGVLARCSTAVLVVR